MTHRRAALLSAAFLLLLAGTAANAAPANGEAVTVCKPGSAIRHQIDRKTDLPQVREAPAQGSCRGTANAKRDEMPALAASAEPEEFFICKPGSAIRYRVTELPDVPTVRLANKHGSCRGS